MRKSTKSLISALEFHFPTTKNPGYNGITVRLRVFIWCRPLTLSFFFQASSATLEKMAASPVPLHQEPVISGDSDLLLCSSAELEPYIDIKDVAMEELGSKMEYDDDDMDLLVPDIDLSASLGLSEWETLYMSMGGSLEPLAFDFAQAEECEGGKTKPSADNSTLLTL